jgi:hypothetical protein
LPQVHNELTMQTSDFLRDKDSHSDVAALKGG